MLDLSLHKKLGELDLDMTLRTESGEIVLLTGPSGHGKTSLLRLIAGLLQPDRGHIICDEQVWYDAAQRIDLPVHERTLGLVFQQYALFPHLTVQGNLAFAKKEERDAGMIEELLTAFGLQAFAQRYPHQLSGGQQQRVALARALVQQPPLLLLDEPFAALDEANRTHILAYLSALHERYRPTILVSSHDVRGLAEFCDRHWVVENGTLAAAHLPQGITAILLRIDRTQAPVRARLRIGEQQLDWINPPTSWNDLPAGTSVQLPL